MARLKIYNEGIWKYIDYTPVTGSISASYSETSMTASYLEIPSGSGAWRSYIDFTTGNLVFTYS